MTTDKPNPCATIDHGKPCKTFGCRGTCKNCGAFVCSDHVAHGRCLACRTTYVPAPAYIDGRSMPPADALETQVSQYLAGLKPVETDETLCPICKRQPCRTEGTCGRTLRAWQQHAGRGRII